MLSGGGENCKDLFESSPREHGRRQCPVRHTCQAGPFATFDRLDFRDSNRNGIGWNWRLDRLQRHIVAQLLQTVDQLASDLWLVLLIVMPGAEFLVKATVANDVEDDRDQVSWWPPP